MTAREVLDGIKASGHARGCTKHSDCQLVTTARLTAALEAVLDLHEQGPGYHVSDVACMACSTAEGYSLWPCPTVAAIETALTT